MSCLNAWRGWKSIPTAASAIPVVGLEVEYFFGSNYSTCQERVPLCMARLGVHPDCSQCHSSGKVKSLVCSWPQPPEVPGTSCFYVWRNLKLEVDRNVESTPRHPDVQRASSYIHMLMHHIPTHVNVVLVVLAVSSSWLWTIRIIAGRVFKSQLLRTGAVERGCAMFENEIFGPLRKIVFRILDSNNSLLPKALPVVPLSIDKNASPMPCSVCVVCWSKGSGQRLLACTLLSRIISNICVAVPSQGVPLDSLAKV